MSGADTDKSKTLSEDDLYNLERQTLINLIQSQKTEWDSCYVVKWKKVEKLMDNFEQGLHKNDANFVPLTPISFLERVKDVYPDYEAIIYKERKYTWKQIYNRCIRFASALSKVGVGKGDVVSIMATNTPETFEAHYSVPMTGGVLNTINTRLDTRTVAYILDHSDCKVFIVDRQFHDVAIEALAKVKREITVIDIDDQQANLGELPLLEN